jgi:hypothetical protein
VAGVEFGAFVDQLAGRATVNRVEDVPLTHAFERVIRGEHTFHPEFEEATSKAIEVAGTGCRRHIPAGRRSPVLRATGADQVRP